jgi:hypothetical protein
MKKTMKSKSKTKTKTKTKTTTVAKFDAVHMLGRDDNDFGSANDGEQVGLMAVRNWRCGRVRLRDAPPDLNDYLGRRKSS